jgi:hypothetical protein
MSELRKTRDETNSYEIKNNVIVTFKDGKSELVKNAHIQKNGIVIGYLNEHFHFVETGFIPMYNIKTITFE